MRLTFFCILFFSIQIFGFGQQLDRIELEQSATRFVEKFANFNASHPDEKLFIKTNKDLYHPGENLWFSAFLIDYYTHKNSIISQSIYVKLIDLKSNVVAESTIPNYGGFTNGDIILSDTLNAGIYQLMAYSTLNIQTKNQNSFFKKYIKIEEKVSNNVMFEIMRDKNLLNIQAISVQTGGGIDDLSVNVKVLDKKGNVQKHLIKTVKGGQAQINLNNQSSFITLRCRYLGINTLYHDILEQDTKLHIWWKKETGNFIEGLPGKLLYTLKTSAGLPIMSKGILLDEEDRLIDSIQTDHNGIGELNIIPYRNRPLKIKFNNYDQPFSIPLPAEKGTNYILRKKDNNLIVNLYSNNDTVKNIFLLGQIRGKSEFISLINFKNDFTEVIDIQELPEGILHFYLLNGEGKVLGKSLRLIEKKNQQISATTTSNGGIEKLNVANSSSAVNVNISVQNEKTINSDYSYSLKEYMLLFSELDDAKTSFMDGNVDNLLNTLHHNKYNWFEQGAKPAPPVNDFTLGFDKLSGVARYENGEPVQKKSIVLYSQNDGIKSWFEQTDEQGKFKFLEVDNNPKATLILSASGIKKNKTVNFTIERKSPDLHYEFDPIIWQTKSNFHIESDFDSLVDFSDAIVLDNVVKKGDTYNADIEERRTKLDRVKTVDGEKLQFSSGGGQLGILPIIQQVTSIYSWNRTTGQVLLRAPQTFSSGYGVIFYLNNTRMGDNMFNLNFLTIEEIDEVKVYRPGPDAAIFPFAPDGVIQFITKKGFAPSNDIKSKDIKILEPQYSQTRDYNVIEITPEKSDNNTSIWTTDYFDDDTSKYYEYKSAENDKSIISVIGINENGEVMELIRGERE